MATETLVRFTDHPRKQIFRQSWAKPLLECITNRVNQRLVYMGLPGIAALDIQAWLPYLKMVYAFQCLDEDKDYEVSLSEFETLNEYLSKCTTAGTLDDYGLYQGYLEQVVMTGIDDVGTDFNQNHYVTIYNLDFCNPLSSPFDVIYSSTMTRKCTKLDAIDKLLDIQNKHEAQNPSDKFVMFLTVNSSFLENNYDDIKQVDYVRYKKTLENLPEKSKNIRLVRAYSFFYLNKIFTKYGFQAEFFPTMYYEGSSGYRDKKTNQYFPTMMLTFTILGTKFSDALPHVDQSLSHVLNQKFLFATDKVLSCFKDKVTYETDFDPNIESVLHSSFTYNNLW